MAKFLLGFSAIGKTNGGGSSLSGKYSAKLLSRIFQNNIHQHQRTELSSVKVTNDLSDTDQTLNQTLNVRIPQAASRLSSSRCLILLKV
jgi:hypothetical protein